MAFSLDQFYRINRRALIWIILAALLYLLRDFFSLVFLTFVLAFIAAPLAGALQRWLRLSRRISIIVVYGCFLVGMVAFVRFVVPSVTREAYLLGGNLDQIENKVFELKTKLVAQYPSLDTVINGYLRGALPESDASGFAAAEPRPRAAARHLAGSAAATSGSLSQTASDSRVPRDAMVDTFVLAYLRERLPEDELTRLERSMQAAPAAPAAAGWMAGPGMSATPVGSGAVALESASEDEILIRQYIRLEAARLNEQMPSLIGGLWHTMTTTLLALLFSFLISLDTIRLGQEIQSLRASRLRDFYEQTAQPVIRFAYVVGRALHAQLMIALANTGLTLIGLIALGIPSLAMLSLIVFVCSFIPVLGGFISTVPMVLIALNSAGVSKAVLVVVFVILIRFVEAFWLSPVIYGRHLKLNPVVVLLILFLGHHLFGIWGMLLGVPVTYYFLHYVFGVPVWGEGKIDLGPRPLGAMRQTAPPAAGTASAAAAPGSEGAHVAK